MCIRDRIIADSQGADDLAGIMGGVRTGVSDETNEMFLEIAVFDPIKVSKTGRKINLNSDARYRFERGLDQDCPKWVHNYVANLVLEICGGEVSYPQHIGTGINWKREIKFNSKRVYELTGVKVENKNISEILNALGFTLITVSYTHLTLPTILLV